MGKFFREPLVHFLLIGAGLSLLFGWRGGPASLPAGQSGPQSAKIVVSQGDVDQMTATFTRTWHRPPTEEEAKALVEDFLRDEIYYREAVAAGLDRDDGHQAADAAEDGFIFEDITTQVEPADEDLLAFMKKDPERYLVDPQVSFRQVYVNAAKRGKNAEADARQILAQHNEGIDPDSVGDPLLLDTEIRLSPLWDIRNGVGRDRKMLSLCSIPLISHPSVPERCRLHCVTYKQDDHEYDWT